MMISIWALAAIGLVTAFAGCVIGWRLRGSVQHGGHGGMLDLTPVAAELDLDWQFPIVNTERSGHPQSWCSPDYCGRERGQVLRRRRAPLTSG